MSRKAWIVGQMASKIAALHLDFIAPAIALQIALELPFEQMQEKHGQPADQFALLAFAHTFYFPGDVLDICGGQLPGAQQRRLLVGPGVEVGSRRESSCYR